MGMRRNMAGSARLGRILIVEDDESVRTPVRLMLAKAGYEVLEAEGCDEAIRLLNEGDNPLAVDAILCDIRMPKKDGTVAIAYFRSQYPGVPVVVLSGYPDVQLAVSLLKQGVKDYLVKPVSREALLAVIARAVNQHILFENTFVV